VTTSLRRQAVSVELRGVTKVYEGSETPAVNGVDLHIDESEFVVLLGPSGCGKTTLLRTVAGLERPTGGEVLIGGNVVNGLPPRARKVAMVFQSYALYPHKTVLANIVFPLKAEKIDPAERQRKATWAAELLGISELFDRKPRHLSGGERQRVALARALVREPSVFLLDEPLSNLDAKLRATARDDLKDFQTELGTTTIYVTHDQVEAMGMGDRIAVMYAGSLRQVGLPRDVYSDPADTFVATFLGSPPMNLIEREDVIVGFRPESALPASSVGAGSDQLTVPLKVHRIEYLSGDRHLHGVVGGLGPETRVIVRLPFTEKADIEPDETYDMSLPVDALRFFDVDTGERAPARPLRV
jgi:multiple sugar transport system ATP-binding protein